METINEILVFPMKYLIILTIKIGNIFFDVIASCKKFEFPTFKSNKNPTISQLKLPLLLLTIQKYIWYILAKTSLVGMKRQWGIDTLTSPYRINKGKVDWMSQEMRIIAQDMNYVWTKACDDKPLNSVKIRNSQKNKKIRRNSTGIKIIIT